MADTHPYDTFTITEMWNEDHLMSGGLDNEDQPTLEESNLFVRNDTPVATRKRPSDTENTFPAKRSRRRPSASQASVLSVEEVTPALTAATEVIELSSDEEKIEVEPALYHSKHLNTNVRLSDSKDYIRNKLQKSIEAAAKNLDEEDTRKVRIQEIVAVIRTEKKKFILQRWEKDWIKLLKKIRTHFETEEQRAEDHAEQYKDSWGIDALEALAKKFRDEVRRLKDLEEARKKIIEDFREYPRR